MIHGVVCSVGLDKCAMTRIHHYSVTQPLHCPQGPLCSVWSSLSSSLSSTNFSSFTMSIVLPFPECHMVGTFSDRLLLLSYIHLKFLHVFLWLETYFFLAERYSTVWMHPSLFIHSPAEGHPGCFCVLAVVNKMPVNV